MAQAQKAGKQPQDPYAKQAKTLASSVQRLRGWVGSDPSKASDLADALVQLTAHRLLGNGYAAAATDAQEAVRRAAQLLTANGPIGPYTSVTDAARYMTAVIHLATVQAGLGLPDAAGRTIESLQDIQQQLRELGLAEQVEPQTAIWALSSTARGALASGDLATANAYADAALARLAESGLRDDPAATYLVLGTDRLAADSRWAAGLADEALTYLHSAQERYEAEVDGRLQQPARLSPALVERLAQPLFGLYRDLADRLAASDQVDLGLVTRRTLVERLQGLTARLGDPARAQLAFALADLASDLLRADRVDEADAAAAEAAAAAATGSGLESTRLLVAAVRARVLTRIGRSGEAVQMLRELLPAQASGSAARAVGLLALAEALQAGGDLDGARSAEDAFNELARGLAGPAFQGVPTRTAVEDLARGVVSRGTRSVSWAPLEPAASYAATTTSVAGTGQGGSAELRPELQGATAAWLEAERAEAHRLELERQEQARLETERREAERLEAERAAASRLAAQRAQAEEAQRLEAERRTAAEEAERVERKRRREERLEEHRLEVERREAERQEAERLQTERRDAERLGDERREVELLDAERLEAERRSAALVEAERLELERLQAELAELERVEERARGERLEADRLAAEQAEAEQAERIKLEEEREAERVEEARLKAERAEAARQEPAQINAESLEAKSPAAAQEELALAQQAWLDAKAQGDRRAARRANERVVELLRPLAEADLAGYGPQLQGALEDLSSARLRSGDVWGSRAPSREAKALARRLSG
jgi:hypothetical protein